MRTYTEKNGQPDFDLEKFAINSLISATHTSQMDDEDKKDIIKKVEDSGTTEQPKEEPTENETTEEPSNDIDFGDDSVDEGNFILANPKKNNMFQPGSNDILKKSSIFAESIKNKLMELVQESDKTITKPTTKPQTEKPIKRRDMPFLPNVEPDIKTKPKAHL